MSAPGPQVVNNVKKYRFEIMADGRLAGTAEDRRSGSTTAFLHTVVEPEGKGWGLQAGAVARAGVDTCREERAAVLPFCPFIRGFIQRHPLYDLVPPAPPAVSLLAPAGRAEPFRPAPRRAAR
jgi:predicted GNAT family acetyltransferase